MDDFTVGPGNVNSTVSLLTDGEEDPFIPISKEMYLSFKFVAKVILTPSLCILGLVGNTIGLVVLRNDTRLPNQNFFVYMYMLMASHMTSSLNGLIYSIPDVIIVYDYYLSNFLHQHMRLVCVYIGKVSNTFSASILLMLSAERLLALIKPFTFRDLWLPKHPRLLLLFSLFTIAVFMIPFPVCCNITKFVNADNKTEYSFGERNAFWKEFMDTYVFISSIVQFFIGPLFVLLTNMCIPVAYHRYNKIFASKIKVDSQRKNQQSKITIVVLSIVILYLMLSVPYLLALTMDFIDDDYSFSGRYSHVFFFFSNLGSLFIHLNAACDSVIYIFVSKHFWNLFKVLFCKHCLTERPRHSSFSQSETAKCPTCATSLSTISTKGQLTKENRFE